MVNKKVAVGLLLDRLCQILLELHKGKLINKYIATFELCIKMNYLGLDFIMEHQELCYSWMIHGKVINQKKVLLNCICIFFFNRKRST